MANSVRIKRTITKSTISEGELEKIRELEAPKTPQVKKIISSFCEAYPNPTTLETVAHDMNENYIKDAWLNSANELLRQYQIIIKTITRDGRTGRDKSLRKLFKFRTEAIT